MYKIRFFPWIILITWLIAIGVLLFPFSFTLTFNRALLEHILISLPIIVVITSMAFEVEKKQPPSQWRQIKNEFLNMTLFFMLGALINLVVDHNNSDLRAWWSIGLLFLLFYALFFSLLFTTISYVFKFHHAQYHFFCACLMLFALGSHSFVPYVSIGHSPQDSLYVFCSALLLFHLSVSLAVSLTKQIRVYLRDQT